MRFRLSTKEPASASSATAVADPSESTIDIPGLLARLTEGYREADALRKRLEELKKELPGLGEKASKIARQCDILEAVGQNASARIGEANAPLLAARKEIKEIPPRIAQIGRQLRAEVEQTRLAILDGLRSKYLTRVDETPVGKIDTLLRAARADADTFDPVLCRWGGYSTDFGWQPIDTNLRPAVLTGRWIDAVKHLQVFRRNLS